MGELEKGSHLGRSIAQYAKIDECHFLVKKKKKVFVLLDAACTTTQSFILWAYLWKSASRQQLSEL